MESFTDKHRPEKLESVVGHPTAIGDIRKWGENWSSDKPPLLLYGPAGTGKTSTAEALSNDMEWQYTEVNASGQRRKEDIDSLIRQIRSQTDKPRLFVLDEVDSIDGRSLSTLYTILEEPPNPIICTANEKWKVPDGIENTCKVYKFNVKQDSIKNHLKDIAQKEGIEISSRQLGQLATRNGIRDAINDLQEYSQTGTTDWDARDTDDSPFAVTRRALQNKNYLGDMTPDDMIEFFNENIKNEFDGVEAMRSYQAIAEADKWQGKVDRTQDYSWWRYVGAIAEEVGNLRLSEPYGDWVNVDYPKSRRNYTPSADSDTKKATLYKEIQGNTAQANTLSAGFHEFHQIVIPFIRSLSDEEKKQIVLSHSLSEKSMKCIGISPSDFEDWEVDEIDDSKTEENEKETEQKGIFDF